MTTFHTQTIEVCFNDHIYRVTASPTIQADGYPLVEVKVYKRNRRHWRRLGQGKTRDQIGRLARSLDKRNMSTANSHTKPCPTCNEPDALTPSDVSRGYQCGVCANAKGIKLSNEDQLFTSRYHWGQVLGPR